MSSKFNKISNLWFSHLILRIITRLTLSHKQLNVKIKIQVKY
jgi:hypothetical protein